MIIINKKCRSLTVEEFELIIKTIKNGTSCFRANKVVYCALILEGNLSIRISDILQLKLEDIILDGNRYCLNIKEIKTGKPRNFTIPNDVYLFVQDYCIDNNIKRSEKIFDITEREIQKHLKKVCEYLNLDGNISTSSFRKFFATQIYVNNNYNILLVQRLLQHSSPAITQRYIGISGKEVEQALQNHIHLL